MVGVMGWRGWGEGDRAAAVAGCAFRVGDKSLGVVCVEGLELGEDGGEEVGCCGVEAGHCGFGGCLVVMERRGSSGVVRGVVVEMGRHSGDGLASPHSFPVTTLVGICQ